MGDEIVCWCKSHRTTLCLMMLSSTDSSWSLHVWSCVFHWQPHWLITHAMHLQDNNGVNVVCLHFCTLHRRSLLSRFTMAQELTVYLLRSSRPQHSCRTCIHRVLPQFYCSLWSLKAPLRNLETQSKSDRLDTAYWPTLWTDIIAISLHYKLGITDSVLLTYSATK